MTTEEMNAQAGTSYILYSPATLRLISVISIIPPNMKTASTLRRIFWNLRIAFDTCNLN
jgi:hypothetical protein